MMKIMPLVHLFLFVDAELAGAHVDEEDKAATEFN